MPASTEVITVGDGGSISEPSSARNPSQESRPSSPALAAPGGQQPPMPRSHVSFRVELEFLIAYSLEGDPDPAGSEGADLPPLLRIPESLRADALSDYADREARDYWCATEVRRALADVGLPAYEASNHRPGSIQALQADPCNWVGGSNAFLIYHASEIEEFFPFYGYRFVGMTLMSPTMWDRDANFDLIALAVRTLTSRFRCRVNPSCEFRVNVGVGPGRWIDPMTLRRLGAFLWAGAPLVSTLHPPERTVMKWSRSARMCDTFRIGRGEEGVAAEEWEELDPVDKRTARLAGRDRWLGEVYEIGDDPFVRRLAGSLPWNSTHHRKFLKEIKEHFGDDESFDHFGAPGRHMQDWAYMGSSAADEAGDGAADAASEERENSTQAESRATKSVRNARRFGPPKIDHGTPDDIATSSTGTLVPPHRSSVFPATERISAPPLPGNSFSGREDRDTRIPLRPDVRDDARAQVNNFEHAENSLIPSLSRFDVTTPPARQDVMSGVKEILAADYHAGLVGGVIVGTEECPNLAAYNWANYLPHSLVNPDLSARLEGGHFKGPRHSNRDDEDEESQDGGNEDAGNNEIPEAPDDTTFGFCEAAGSLEPGWVVTWAMICCGIMWWCRDAADDDYVRVLRLLAWAQEEGGEYDVVDLLRDMGMHAEAKFVEGRIANMEDLGGWECRIGAPEEDSLLRLEAWGGLNEEQREILDFMRSEQMEGAAGRTE